MTRRSHWTLGLPLALLTGTALLSGCGPDPAPVSHTTTTTEETTTRPFVAPPVIQPMASSTTTTRTQRFEQ